MVGTDELATGLAEEMRRAAVGLRPTRENRRLPTERGIRTRSRAWAGFAELARSSRRSGPDIVVLTDEASYSS